MDTFAKKIDDVFTSFPETSFRFIIAGMNGSANSGFAGMALTPWDECAWRKAKGCLQPQVQGKLGQEVTGLQVFVFSLPPLPGNSQGMPVQMVVSSPSSFETVYAATGKLKAAANKSGMFIVTDSDLEFNNPVVRVSIDQAKANDIGITMQDIGDALATLLGGNDHRFSLEGRSYEVIPRSAARCASASTIWASTTPQDESGGRGPALDRAQGLQRHRAERAHPVQPAQLGHLLSGADAGGDDGPGGRLPAAAGGRNPAARLPLRLPLAVAPVRPGRGNQLTVTFAFSRCCRCQQHGHCCTLEVVVAVVIGRPPELAGGWRTEIFVHCSLVTTTAVTPVVLSMVSRPIRD